MAVGVALALALVGASSALAEPPASTLDPPPPEWRRDTGADRTFAISVPRSLQREIETLGLDSWKSDQLWVQISYDRSSGKPLALENAESVSELKDGSVLVEGRTAPWWSFRSGQGSVPYTVLAYIPHGPAKPPPGARKLTESALEWGLDVRIQCGTAEVCALAPRILASVFFLTSPGAVPDDHDWFWYCAAPSPWFSAVEKERQRTECSARRPEEDRRP